MLEREALREILTQSDKQSDTLRKQIPPFDQVFDQDTFRQADDESDVSLQIAKDRLTISATLDRTNPLTEARWVKTGDVDSWLISLALANGQDPKSDQFSQWRGKIVVEDPDPVSPSRFDCCSWLCLCLALCRARVFGPALIW